MDLTRTKSFKQQELRTGKKTTRNEKMNIVNATHINLIEYRNQYYENCVRNSFENEDETNYDYVKFRCAV